LLGSAASLWKVSEVTNFTWFVPAQAQLTVYGFFAMTMFGAVYYIVPRLVQTEFPMPKLVSWHLRCSGAGILLYVVPLLIGGIKQGFGLNDAGIAFLDVMKGTLMFVRISTMGELLMLLGNFLLVVNLLALLSQAGRACFQMALVANSPKAKVAA